MGKTVVVTKEIQFDAGHRVPNHKSKCRNPHGHRYRVVVTCHGEIVEEAGAPDEGMLIDFGDLKRFLITHVHDPLDHGFIIWENDQELLDCFQWYDPATFDEGGPISGPTWKIIHFPYIPTAENIAVWIDDQLRPIIDAHWRGNLELFDVEVWETPTSSASY